MYRLLVSYRTADRVFCDYRCYGFFDDVNGR